MAAVHQRGRSAVVSLVGDLPCTICPHEPLDVRTRQECLPDLMGKMAMVAAGHAIALVPGLLLPSLRHDVTPVPLRDPPTRGIYAVLPPENGRADAPLIPALIGHLSAAIDELAG
jgi:DNA-binding transcriptional LysR family regulator